MDGNQWRRGTYDDSSCKLPSVMRLCEQLSHAPPGLLAAEMDAAARREKAGFMLQQVMLMLAWSAGEKKAYAPVLHGDPSASGYCCEWQWVTGDPRSRSYFPVVPDATLLKMQSLCFRRVNLLEEFQMAPGWAALS